MSETRTFELRYVGARFEGARVPLDVLPDLPAFRDLLVSYVKAGWREAHTDRERLPKGFIRGLKFDLIGIKDGSAVPKIQWDRDNAQLALPEFRDEIEVLVGGAFDRVVKLVDGAASATSADSLDGDEIRALNRFGSALLDGERIEFVGQNGSDGKVVYLDAYRRKRLLTRGRNSYQVRFDSVGKLLGSAVDEAGLSGHIDISTSEHGPLALPLSPAAVKADFDGRIDADVQFSLTIEVDDNDKYLRVVDVLEIDIIDAKIVADLERCRGRIRELSSVADGWHDGFGQKPSPEAEAVSLRLLARNPGLAGSFRIFPTETGGLVFEFRKEGWEYSVNINADARVEIYGVRLNSTDEIDTELLDFDGEEFRRVFEQIAGRQP